MSSAQLSLIENAMDFISDATQRLNEKNWNLWI